MQHRHRLCRIGSSIFDPGTKPHDCTHCWAHSSTHHCTYCRRAAPPNDSSDTATCYDCAGGQLCLRADCPVGSVWRCWVRGLHDVCVGVDLLEAERLLLPVYLNGNGSYEAERDVRVGCHVYSLKRIHVYSCERFVQSVVAMVICDRGKRPRD